MLGATLLLASAAIVVEGGATCPTPSEVADRLRSLLPEADAGRPADRARLRPLASGLRVELVRASGAVVAERTLADGERWDRVADEAAVLPECIDAAARLDRRAIRDRAAQRFDVHAVAARYLALYTALVERDAGARLPASTPETA